MNTKKNQLGLSKTQWVILIIAIVSFLFVVWKLAAIFKWAIAINEQISLSIAALALVFSAYSSMITRKVKKFEIEKGYQAAKALIEADAHEALKESHNIYDRLMEISSSEQWNNVLTRLKVLEKRYERRQDQFPFLAAHLPPDKFLEIQSFYLEVQRHFDEAEELAVTNPGEDGQVLILRRKEILKNKYLNREKDILNVYKKLEFKQLPLEIQNLIEFSTKTKQLKCGAKNNI